MVMKYTIPMIIRGFMPDKVSSKSFFTKVANRFTEPDKVEITCFLAS